MIDEKTSHTAAMIGFQFEDAGRVQEEQPKYWRYPNHPV
jgi:hypothetical protein